MINLAPCPRDGLLWTAGRRMTHGSPIFQWMTPQYTVNVAYTNWDANQPDFYLGQEDCVTMRTFNGMWDDDNCDSTTICYVCEVDMY